MKLSALLSAIPGYPLLSKQALEEIRSTLGDIKTLKQAFTRLTRLKKSGEAIDESELKSVSIQIREGEVIKALIKDSSDEPTHFFKIAEKIFESDEINDEAGLTLARLVMDEITRHERSPLGLAKLFITVNPFMIAAYLMHFISESKVSPVRLLYSGFLSQVFQYNIINLEDVIKSYQLIDGFFSDSEFEDKVNSDGGLLLQLVDSHTTNERGFERYTLRGTMVDLLTPDDIAKSEKLGLETSETGLLSAPTELIPFACTITYRNLRNLYALFGVSFLAQVLEKHLSSLPGTIILEIQSLEGKALISFFDELSNAENSDKLIEYALRLLTDTQEAALLKTHLKWPILLKNPYLVRKLERESIEKMISEELDAHTLQSFLIILEDEKFFFSSFSAPIARRVVNLLYRFSTLLDDEVIKEYLPYVSGLQGIVSWDYQYTQDLLGKRLSDMVERGIDEAAYIDIEHCYFEGLKKIGIIKHIVSYADGVFRFLDTSSYPKDKYALQTIIIKRAYERNKDLDIRTLLTVFHTPTQYADYEEPKLRQDQGMCRSLCESMLELRDDKALFFSLYRLLKTLSEDKPWWAQPCKDKTIADYLMETPSEFLEMLFLDAENQDKKTACLTAFEEGRDEKDSLLHRFRANSDCYKTLLPLYPLEKRISLLQARYTPTLRSGLELITGRSTTLLNCAVFNGTYLDLILEILPKDVHFQVFNQRGVALCLQHHEMLIKIMAGFTHEQKKIFLREGASAEEIMIAARFILIPEFFNYLSKEFDENELSDLIIDTDILLYRSIKFDQFQELYFSITPARRRAYIETGFLAQWLSSPRPRIAVPENIVHANQIFQLIINDLNPDEAKKEISKMLCTYLNPKIGASNMALLPIILRALEDELSKVEDERWFSGSDLAHILLNTSEEEETPIIERLLQYDFIALYKMFRRLPIDITRDILITDISGKTVIEVLVEHFADVSENAERLKELLMTIPRQKQLAVFKKSINGCPLIYQAKLHFSDFKTLLSSHATEDKRELLSLKGADGRLCLTQYGEEPELFTYLQEMLGIPLFCQFMTIPYLVISLAQTPKGMWACQRFLGREKYIRRVIDEKSYLNALLNKHKNAPADIKARLDNFNPDEVFEIARNYLSAIEDFESKDYLFILAEFKNRLTPQYFSTLFFIKDRKGKTMCETFFDTLEECMGYCWDESASPVDKNVSMLKQKIDSFVEALKNTRADYLNPREGFSFSTARALTKFINAVRQADTSLEVAGYFDHFHRDCESAKLLRQVTFYYDKFMRETRERADAETALERITPSMGG